MSHYIVCGLGIIGYRITELLHRLGEEVVVISTDGQDERLRAVEAAGIRVVRGDARDRKVLLAAGLYEARAVLAATSKDLINVEISLDAKRLRSDLPIVARLFDQNLARQLETAFGLRRALGMAALAAPNFAAAALGGDVLGSFRFDGDGLVVSRLRVSDHRELIGAPAESLAGGAARLLARGRGGERSVARAEPIGEQESLTLLSRRSTWVELAGSRMTVTEPTGGSVRVGERLGRAAGNVARMWREASGALKTVFVGLSALMVISVVVFHFGMKLDLIDAFYFMVTTLTTTGYGDISAKDQAVWMKLYVSLMMLLGSATIATVYSLITGFIVTARVRQLLGRKSVPERDHVVVVGLGNLGLRVIEELADHGVEVAAVDRDSENPYLTTVQEDHAVVSGDARMAAVLESANVGTARAVLALTGDDAVNLSVALSAKELNPQARIVVRLFDAEFARKVEESPAIDAALGASRIAAPTFVASAMFPDVLKAFVDGDSMCVLLRSGESLSFRAQERPEVVWRGSSPAYDGNPKASGGIVAVWRPLVRTFEGQ